MQTFCLWLSKTVKNSRIVERTTLDPSWQSGGKCADMIDDCSLAHCVCNDYLGHINNFHIYWHLHLDLLAQLSCLVSVLKFMIPPNHYQLALGPDPKFCSLQSQTIINSELHKGCYKTLLLLTNTEGSYQYTHSSWLYRVDMMINTIKFHNKLTCYIHTFLFIFLFSR